MFSTLTLPVQKIDTSQHYQPICRLKPLDTLPRYDIGQSYHQHDATFRHAKPTLPWEPDILLLKKLVTEFHLLYLWHTEHVCVKNGSQPNCSFVIKLYVFIRMLW
jgi:G:T-mismatch repair DNA endonuclease (very short patch repair protein)